VSHGVVPRGLAEGARGGIEPLARRLHAAGISANGVTATGVLLTLLGAALLALAQPLPALLALALGSAADTLDGALARAAGGGSRLGAFLDSTADRLADAAVFAAALWLGHARADGALVAGALAALIGSFGTSYMRAKAESLGLRATVGPAPREARVLILLGGIAGWAALGTHAALTVATAAIAALSAITLTQRAATTARALSGKDGK
jgi:CDP-diacylglycerol--glycerol-3-phosphate 3-phosphatidyltransferase